MGRHQESSRGLAYISIALLFERRRVSGRLTVLPSCQRAPFSCLMKSWTVEVRTLQNTEETCCMSVLTERKHQQLHLVSPIYDSSYSFLSLAWLADGKHRRLSQKNSNKSCRMMASLAAEFSKIFKCQESRSFPDPRDQRSDPYR